MYYVDSTVAPAAGGARVASPNMMQIILVKEM